MITTLLIKLSHLSLFLHRKASLTLIRKMIHYVSPSILGDMCDFEEDGKPKTFPSELVAVLASVMDSEVRSSWLIIGARQF